MRCLYLCGGRCSLTDDFSRYTGGDRTGGNISRDHGAGANNRPPPYGYAIEHGNAITEPDIVFDDDAALATERLLADVFAEVKTMVVRIERTVGRDLYPVANCEMPQIGRQLAARLDMCVVTDSDAAALANFNYDILVQAGATANGDLAAGIRLKQYNPATNKALRPERDCAAVKPRGARNKRPVRQHSQLAGAFIGRRGQPGECIGPPTEPTASSQFQPNARPDFLKTIH